MRIAAVVLAGGEGSRIGGDKPLRLLAGQSLLDRAVTQARRWSADVAVSFRHAGQFPLPDDIEQILDEAGEGPLAGLQAALDFARRQNLEAVLTVPCDVPFAPDDLAERLCDALGGCIAAALATSGGQLHPACGLWMSATLDALPAYRATGRSSLWGFAEHVGFAAVEWPDAPFFNVNSAADLAEAEARLRRR